MDSSKSKSGTPDPKPTGNTPDPQASNKDGQKKEGSGEMVWYWQLLAAIGLIGFLLYGYTVFFPEVQDIQLKRYLDDKKYTVPIIEGMMPLSQGELMMDTYNIKSEDYLSMPSSSNIKGGSQYSYSFWIQKRSLQHMSNKAILLRGVKNKPKYVAQLELVNPVTNASATGTVFDSATIPITQSYVDWANRSSQNYAVSDETINESVLVKSPCIRFGKNQDEIIVEFNTLKTPHNSFVIPAQRLINIFNDLKDENKWVMFTFTFADFVNVDGFESGVNICFYVNTTLVANKVIRNDALKVHNHAPLYIMPDSGTSGSAASGNIADITFYNYALKAGDLETVVRKGFNQKTFTTPRMRNALKIKQKYYNLTISNELDML